MSAKKVFPFAVKGLMLLNKNFGIVLLLRSPGKRNSTAGRGEEGEDQPQQKKLWSSKHQDVQQPSGIDESDWLRKGRLRRNSYDDGRRKKRTRKK